MRTLSFKHSMIALAIALVFASCGGDKEQKGTAETPESTEQTANATKKNDKHNTSTVEGRLERAGLKLDAVKPDNRFAEAGLITVNDDGTGIKLYISGNEKISTEDKKAYFTKLKNALAAISEDGKVYNSYYGLGEPVEMSLDTINWEAFYILAQWSYNLNGKWITITAGTIPAEKEGYTYCYQLDFNY